MCLCRSPRSERTVWHMQQLSLERSNSSRVQPLSTISARSSVVIGVFVVLTVVKASARSRVRPRDFARRMSSSTADAANYSSPSLNAGGASDVIIVAHADGTLRSTAWHVVFDRVDPNNFSIDRVAPSPTGAVVLDLNGHRFEATIKLRATAAMDPAVFDSVGTTPPAAFLAELAASDC